MMFWTVLWLRDEDLVHGVVRRDLREAVETYRAWIGSETGDETGKGLVADMASVEAERRLETCRGRETFTCFVTHVK